MIVRHVRLRTVLPLVGTLLLAGCAGVASPRAAAGAAGADRPARHAERPSPAVVADARPTVAAQVERFRSARSHETVARPVAVRLPAIGVSSSLQRLGRNADGTIAVPDDWQQAGWYREGPKPGQLGPAVVLGHVDSTAGPAVFHRLRELRPGDMIHVDRADDTTATFVVERAEWHAKTRFPTHEVYLPTLRASLRLVTCGGPFDAASGHYRDNLVVFASLVEEHRQR